MATAPAAVPAANPGTTTGNPQPPASTHGEHKPSVRSDLWAPLHRHHFLLRRLHSLTGIMPVGVFVIFHLFTNMQMAIAQVTGQLHYFQDEVDFIHSLPALLFLEIFGLWLPIAFHAGLGIVYMWGGKSNSMSYRYGGNLRYTLQRWTAWIALFFIFFHVASLRWGWTFWIFEYPWGARAEGTEFAALAGVDSYPLAHATTAMALQTGPLGGLFMVLAYLIGTLAVVYHWSNGLWTAAITWGLTLTQTAMKRWGLICLGMGIALTLFSIAAIWGAWTYEVTPEDERMLRYYVESMEAGGGH